MNVSQTIIFQMGRNIQELSTIYQRESLGIHTLNKPIVMFGGITMIWNGQSWEKIIIYILLKKLHIYPLKVPFSCLIYTASDQIEQLETLIVALPEVQFKIAARVIVNENLSRLVVYPNVTVYSGTVSLEELDRELVETCQLLFRYQLW